MNNAYIRNVSAGFALAFACGIGAFGCASTQEAAPSVEGLEVKLRRVEVESASFEEMKLKVILLASNPGLAPLALEGGEISLQIAGPGAPENQEDEDEAPASDEASEPDVSGIVTGELATGMAPTGTLEAQQRTEIPVQVSLPLPTDAEALARLLAWLRMTVKVDGALVAEGTSIPVSGTREVATPRLPRVVVQEAQVASVDRGAKGVAFFSLGLDNPNSFDIVVDKFAWGASVGDKELLQAGEGSLERVPPSSVATFEDTLQLNQETYGKGVRRLLRQARVPYRLEGFMEIRGIRQPFVFEGEMEFAR